MPSAVFPVPAFKTVPPRQGAPGSPLRVRTRVQRNRLDQQLAGGAEPTASAELNLRAAQLRTHSERTRIAKALVKAIGSGHPEARAFMDSLSALSSRLEDDLPADYRGVAQAALIVGWGAPRLRAMRGPDLRREIDAARVVLDTRREFAADLRTAA